MVGKGGLKSWGSKEGNDWGRERHRGEIADGRKAGRVLK